MTGEAPRRPLGRTGLRVHPLCLGTNVFGWTIDEPASFAVLDAYLDGGGNFLDTADYYSAWVPGHRGGEAETVLGHWLASRRVRDRVVIATKVGKGGPGQPPGLAPGLVRAGLLASLRRLGTDHVDLLYAHQDDPSVPLDDTLGAMADLVREGKVGALGASNYPAQRLAEALARGGSYQVYQPLYNLLDRDEYEGGCAPLCHRHGVAVVPYAALARGFLTGKYRAGRPPPTTPRARQAGGYLTARGTAVLHALDEVAGTLGDGIGVAQVALAWLLARPGVTAPIASATSPTQLAELMRGCAVRLTGEQVRRLAAAGG